MHKIFTKFFNFNNYIIISISDDFEYGFPFNNPYPNLSFWFNLNLRLI